MRFSSDEYKSWLGSFKYFLWNTLSRHVNDIERTDKAPVRKLKRQGMRAYSLCPGALDIDLRRAGDLPGFRRSSGVA